MDECKHCRYSIEFVDDLVYGEFWRHLGTRLATCNWEDPDSTFAEPA